MCMLKNAEESCELKVRVNELDGRLTKVETAVAEMRNESRAGFDRVTDAVNALGHDFGNRMNTIDRRLIEEKEKWGTVLRRCVAWSLASLLVVAGAAAGVNLWKIFTTIH